MTMPDENTIRKKLHSYKLDYGLIEKTPYSEEENRKYIAMLMEGQSLPKGVFRNSNGEVDENDEFYAVYEPELTQEEINEYLTFKKLELLKTIRNCAVFFTVLTIISIIGSLWILLGR